MSTETTIEKENELFYAYNVAGIWGSNTCGEQVLCSETTIVTDLNE